MDYPDFDQLARTMTTGASRRSVLRRVVASAITSPMGFLGIASARADGNNDNSKDKKKDKGDKDKGGKKGNSGKGSSNSGKGKSG